MTDLGLKILVDFISEGGMEMSCLCVETNELWEF